MAPSGAISSGSAGPSDEFPEAEKSNEICARERAFRKASFALCILGKSSVFSSLTVKQAVAEGQNGSVIDLSSLPCRK